MSIDNLLLTALGLFLVLLNGFFVAAEFAIVKLRRTQADELAKTHGLRGRVLRTVRTHLDAYLSACQLGITLASLGLGWIGEPAFARLIEPALGYAGITDPKIVHSISFAFAFGLSRSCTSSLANKRRSRWPSGAPRRSHCSPPFRSTFSTG